MSTNTIIEKIESLKELEELMEEVKAEADSIRDELKQTMLDRGTEELEAGKYIMRYQSIVSNRFDSSAFKKQLPDLYKSFIKQSVSRRFSIA